MPHVNEALAQTPPAVPDIESAYRPTHDERARQGFVSMIRKHSIMDMREALHADYVGRVEPELTRKGTPPRDWRAIEKAMETQASFRFYSAVRYNAQEMCYHSVQDPIERALPDMIDTARRAARLRPAGGTLRIADDFEVPRYVSSYDVHLAPGCFHSEYTPDDVAQGALVTLGGKVFGKSVPARRNEGAVAQSVSHWLKHGRPDFEPGRILDMGTAGGRNLIPYLDIYPDAEAHGIDVGAPQLRYGHARAEHLGRAVHFSQQNAERTDFPDGHFDLIVSSFFFHEVTLKATRAILAECRRLLAPGGMIVHMELPPEGMVSDYDNFFWNWDTANNNEPTYTLYRAQDPVRLCVEAGFDPGDCFSLHIPDYETVGPDRFAAFVRGEEDAPPHGRGGWYVFGSRKTG